LSKDSSKNIKDTNGLQLTEVVVKIGRVAKVVKGGRRFSFYAVVVIGDGEGHVGMGKGKAKEIGDAIKKATQNANKNLFLVPLVGTTIPHQIIGKSGAGSVLLKPGPLGTGIIAGKSVRAVLELAGIKDAFSKSLGSRNCINMVRATIVGLKSLRTKEQIEKLRGKKVS